MCPATLIGFHILREVSAERKAFIFPSLLTDTISLITFSLTAVSMATWQGLHMEKNNLATLEAKLQSMWLLEIQF